MIIRMGPPEFPCGCIRVFGQSSYAWLTFNANFSFRERPAWHKLHKFLKMNLTINHIVLLMCILTTPNFSWTKKAPHNGNNPEGKTQCTCGVAPSTHSFDGGKIVGGRVSANHASPWIGALVYSGGGRPSQFCGSSLINDRYVLTAAHCVVGKTSTPSSYQVFLGSNKVNGTDVKPYNILSMFVHPNYDTQTLDNDIALIRLSETVKFTKNIKPVCLASNGAYVGKSANVAGWGTMQKGGNGVNKLRDTWVKVMENSVCLKNYSSASNVKITANMICASYPGRDSCSGDSGGPLVTKENNAFKQIGVVSFGVDCGNAHYPGVYARFVQNIKLVILDNANLENRVTRFHKWIHENTRDGRYCSSK